MSDKVKKGIYMDKEIVYSIEKNKRFEESFSQAFNRIVGSKLNVHLDTSILKKFVKVFIKERIEIDLEPSEFERIRELAK